MTTQRELKIGIVSPILVALVLSGIYFLLDRNTTDGEYQAADDLIKHDVNKRFGPMELRARQGARREIRVLSEKIRNVEKAYPELAPAKQKEIENFYTEQLDMAQREFDLYDED